MASSQNSVNPYLGAINPNAPASTYGSPSLFVANDTFQPSNSTIGTFMNNGQNNAVSGIPGPQMGQNDPFQVQNLLAQGKAMGGSF